MNEIKLKGYIRNIRYSHEIEGVEYDKADIIVPREDGKEDILSLGFKKFSNPYQDDQEIEIKGCIRSYSKKLSDGKNKVSIYVFTYFDIPNSSEDEKDIINSFEVDGRICKMDEIRVNQSGKQSIHFVLANNIIGNGSHKINNYIPCVAWGKTAIELSKLHVSDMITIRGQLHSRTYKKKHDNGEVEIKTAHEAVVLEFEIN